jgi:ComF family protein
MLKSVTNFFTILLDTVLPPRTDFDIVRKLDENSIESLPKATPVENADWIHPLFHYKDKKMRAIVWELKYRDNTRPLPHIGKLLYEEILGLISDITIFNNDAEFILLPIPISLKRRSGRGYNQSEYIAKAILENDLSHTLLYAPQWFEKIKETSEQNKSQSKQERQENLVGCFSADPRIDGKYIILIDDVVTTGSTLLEARKTLLSAGARDVFAFTIAH